MAGGKRRPHRTPTPTLTRAPNRVRHASSATKPAGASRKWNATGYSYAGGKAEAGADPGRPIHLASSSAVAFIDPNPSLDSAVVPSYNYDPAIVGGLGLGFHVEEEEGEEVEEEVEVEEEMAEEEEEEVERGGFISIGGVRVYAEDTSSPEEDDVSGSESSESEGEESDGSSSDDDEDGSEIDEELAKDYIEMIGGSEELMNSEWLAKNDIDAEGGFLELNSSSDEDKEKLGPVDMMNASAVYGMMRKGKKKARKGKSKSGSPMVEIGLSAAMDDLMFTKDPRSARRRGKKEKKALSQLSRSWPREGQRSREYYGDSGGRKKHRKELIAIKRRERMINRGVDLDQINLKLRQLVVHEVDMFSFQPMQSRDCSQVQRLASIYRLRSGCQGSGKKRYVTVTRTSQTCLPSSHDKIRLDKLLGEGIREDFVFNSETMTKSDRQLKGRSKSDRKLSLHQFCSSEDRKEW
ncbi:uncharacterized protein M6B38_358835 [Iris pallida]|uniref:R3H domain-containing protein n=1 Tax=Iris pallida TaxID=29817 RepID=A0AAX6GJF5_IRIPA|nr:uncharacterized protein M6B38_358835 [Iris pallida]